jgi:hypothetical protein
MEQGKGAYYHLAIESPSELLDPQMLLSTVQDAVKGAGSIFNSFYLQRMHAVSEINRIKNIHEQKGSQAQEAQTKMQRLKELREMALEEEIAYPTMNKSSQQETQYLRRRRQSQKDGFHKITSQNRSELTTLQKGDSFDIAQAEFMNIIKGEFQPIDTQKLAEEQMQRNKMAARNIFGNWETYFKK